MSGNNDMQRRDDGDNTQKGQQQAPPGPYGSPISNPYDNSQNYPQLQNQPQNQQYQQPLPPQQGFQQPQGAYYAPQSNQNMVNPQIYVDGGTCQFCHKVCGATERYKSGTITIVWAVVLFFLTGCCCWIPFVLNDCKDRYVYCDNCQNVRKVEKKEC